VKILLDTCVWGGARKILEAAGHDAVWAGAWDIDPGDDEILAIAWREGRVLVTLNKDFGELGIVHDQPHAGIVRLVSWSAHQQASICLSVLNRYGSELQAGAIVTVEPGLVRVRPADGPLES
jgi:predicted nuclease of predicted toxin-antitoxin system